MCLRMGELKCGSWAVGNEDKLGGFCVSEIYWAL